MEKLASVFKSVSRLLSSLLWKPLLPGEEKRQFNFARISLVIGILTTLFTAGALLSPGMPKYVGEFREALPAAESGKNVDADRERALARATDTTQKAFSNFIGSGGGVSLKGGASGGGGQDRSSAMILSRPGVNSSHQLSAGVKITARLLDKVTISDQSVPIIAEVTHGVANDSSDGIKEGSRLFGAAQFQGGSERAQVQFQSLADSSGIVRPIQGIGLGQDGEPGIAGDVHSRGFKNTAGQFVSRFVGAFAEGSESRDFLGNSQGGVKNGLLNAVAATAQDRTNAFAQDLQKEHQWIELPLGTEITVVLTQPFTFKNPGVAE